MKCRTGHPVFEANIARAIAALDADMRLTIKQAAEDNDVNPQTLRDRYELHRTGNIKSRPDTKYRLPQAEKSHIPAAVQSAIKGSRVLVIPDLHSPFHHPDALEFLKAVKALCKTNLTVCLGDEADFHAFSRYPKDPDGMGAGQELKAAIEGLTPFYVEFPEMMVCTSNHTVRPLKLSFMAGLPAAFYPSYSTMLNAPDGWQWRDHWEIDGVRYIHGEGKSGQGAHTAFMKAYKQSVVHGHVHSYAAVSHEGDKFAMNAGCLIDHAAYAFKYARHMPIPVNLGCGVVIDGKSAYFIPMTLDQNNRWTGKLPC